MKKTLGKWKMRKIRMGDSIRSITLDESTNLAYLGCEVNE
jgi:hypothetical protein